MCLSVRMERLFVLAEANLTATKPQSVCAAVGDTSHMSYVGDRNIKNTFCGIHEFQ